MTHRQWGNAATTPGPCRYGNPPPGAPRARRGRGRKPSPQVFGPGDFPPTKLWCCLCALALSPAHTVANLTDLPRLPLQICDFCYATPNQEPDMSLGADRVRITFNPSASSAVDMLKGTAAKFIDQCEALKLDHADNGEVLRCIALAQTHAEDAAMWAVKAATANK